MGQLEDDYAEVRGEIDDLQGRLQRLKIERTVLSNKLYKKSLGLYVGCTVRFTRADTSYLAKVTSISDDYGSVSKPWLMGCRYKKDGTPGKQVTNLFSNWEVVDDG